MADTPRRRTSSHLRKPATRVARPATSGQGARARNAQAPARRRGHAAPDLSTGATGVHTPVRPRSRAQRSRAASGGHSLRGPLLGGVAGLLVVLVAVFAFVIPSCSPDGSAPQTSLANEGSEVQVSIPEGSGAVAIASALKDAGVISSTDDFLAEVQRQKADGSLKSGAYAFTVGQSLDEIIDRLTKGGNSTAMQLTVPEGLTVAQTAARVESALGISASDFTAQAKASNYAGSYAFLANAADDSLEGFLCPKTYDFSSATNLSADTVIRAMLDQYAAEVSSVDFASAEAVLSERYGVQMSDYDIVTLASIIEREAVNDAQRPKVSSVFYNRLKAGMPLQSDATMMYVTGGEVTAEDLKQESPYNTYLNHGLTPTPICAPSLASINAALNPDDTDYLYFYITQTDEWFSATYDEHLAAIEENR